MQVLYPRSGQNYLPLAMEFNAWHTAIRALIELAFTGTPMVLNLAPQNFEPLSRSQAVALWIWLAVYVAFILFALVLLLNLLIAMLSFTFDSVRDRTQ